MSTGKGRKFFILIIGMFLLLAGCVRTVKTIAQQDCSKLSGVAKQDCLYEKAIYLTFEGKTIDAIKTCEQMRPSQTFTTKIKEIVGFFTVGNSAKYYNRCIEKVAYYSEDHSVCNNMVSESFLSDILMHPFQLGDYRESICKSKIDDKVYQANNIGLIWNSIFS
ncbi:MAG: hypothetical protein D6769_02660 [Methanobacteriota archaeon]|nr:MAG: hypothetical protein D6769_02660 [Euryarchaeota archaeon]